MEPLPIDEVLDELAKSLAQAGAAVLRAPTGAGKTTRVPPRVLTDLAHSGQVVVVEPRRVAARAAAARVASEQGWQLGREVGYRIRFDDRSCDSTRLLFVTEGVLLAWLQRDPFLEGVGAIVFDEFHERSLASDLGLSMAERVRRTMREDLRLVVMSATLESEVVSDFLGGCPVVESEGRLHPVEVEYLKRVDERPVWLQASAAVARAFTSSNEGDILVFLPGVGEIRRVVEQISLRLERADVAVHQLYGDLPLERQQAALRRLENGGRRVVLATNVAETSVTVEGVTTVIDGGLERRLEVDPATGFDRLELRSISRGAARQRRGRAGRECPGRCLRLWTASQQSQRLESTPPEVRRVDLAGPLLRLVAWGEAEPLAFPWFETPDLGRATRALELLEALAAIERSTDGLCSATEDGKAMATLGCHPRLARLLLDAAAAGGLKRGARLAALLEERDVFRRPSPSWLAPKCRSDALERLEAVEAFERGRRTSGRLVAQRARRVIESAKQLVRNVHAARASKAKTATGSGDSPKAASTDVAGTGADSTEILLRALLRAFADRLARRREPSQDGRSCGETSERAVLVGGRGVRLASSSGVRDAELFLALDVGRASVAVGAQGIVPSPREALVFQASEVCEEWLDPALVQVERTVVWDEEAERARATRVKRFADLVLDSREVAATTAEVQGALAVAAATQPERFLTLDDPEVQQLLARVTTLAQWHPGLDLPDLSLDAVSALMPQLCAGCRSASDLKKVRLTPFFEGLLEWSQRQALEQYVPVHLELVNGRRGRLLYDPGGGPPILAMRIQELFGVPETPTLDHGRRPVLLHLLAPNQRPQQVTSDLAGFWQGSYAMVKKELAGRYPKHSWPDDPAGASPPQRRPRRRG